MSYLSFEYDPQQIVPVIASFDTDGHVVPLYVRIGGTSYRIISQWTPDRGIYSGVTEYNCKLAVGDFERPLLLKFYSRENTWTIPADNS